MIGDRVNAARKVQFERQGNLNSQMSNSEIDLFCRVRPCPYRFCSNGRVEHQQIHYQQLVFSVLLLSKAISVCSVVRVKTRQSVSWSWRLIAVAVAEKFKAALDTANW